VSLYIPDKKADLIGPNDLVGGYWNPGGRPWREIAEKVVAAFADGFHFLGMAEMLDQLKAKEAIAAAGLEVRTQPTGAKGRYAVVTHPDRLRLDAPVEVLATRRQPTQWRRDSKDVAKETWLYGGDYTDLLTGRTPSIVASHILHQQWNPLRAKVAAEHVRVETGWIQAGGTRLIVQDANMKPNQGRMAPLNEVAVNSHLHLGTIPTFRKRTIDMGHLASTTTKFVSHWAVYMGPIRNGTDDHDLYGMILRGRPRRVTPEPGPEKCPIEVCAPCILDAGHLGNHIPLIPTVR
jgi:hypothetical protein